VGGKTCPACRSDISRHPLGITHCPICGSDLNVIIDLRRPEERSAPTVLIVDDDPDIRAVLTAVLEETGFFLAGSVSNGPDAVMVSQRTQPSYIFLDQFMPAITGAETARLIREVSPASMIVAFSAFLEEQPPWADAHLTKTDVARAAELLRELESERARRS
jgi:CheY-like chemotaxis protein